MSFRVTGIGEILWDLLPEGRRLGGAPTNFACHCKALGARSSIISAIGDDAEGRGIMELLERREFQLDTISLSGLPTSTVSVQMDSDGQPDYTIHEEVAWDALEPTVAAKRAVESAHAVCFGSLAQRSARSRQAIVNLVRSSSAKALRIFDVNLRQRYYSSDLLRESCALANVLKLNEEELPVVSAVAGLDFGSERKKIEALALQFDIDVVALTRGNRGSLLFSAGDWSEVSGLTVEVRDTVGAGDSFLAGLTLGLLHSRPLDEVNRHANELARHVCSHAGATPSIPDFIRNLFTSTTALSGSNQSS